MTMRPRFSLRLFLILFTLIAILFGGAAHFVYRIKDQVRRHKGAVAKLKALGFDIDEVEKYKPAKKPSAYIASVRYWIDDEYCNASGRFRTTRRLSTAEARVALHGLLDVHGIDSVNLKIQHWSDEMADLLVRHRLVTLYLDYESAEEHINSRLSEFKELQVLLVHKPIDDAAAGAIAKLPSLGFLDINLSQLSMNGAASIASCPRLASLSLHGEIASGKCLSQIFQNQSLHVLTLTDAKIESTGIKSLSNATRVTDLYFTDCSLPPGIIATVSKLPALRTLTFHWTEASPSLDYNSLKDCAALQELTLWFSNVRDREFAAMVPNKALRKLSCCGIVSDKALLAFLNTAPQCEVDIAAHETPNVAYSGRRFTVANGALKCVEY